MFLLLSFDSLVVNLLGISLTVLFTLLLVFIIVPAIFGVSFGIRRLYMKTLLQIFQVSSPCFNILGGRGKQPETGLCQQPAQNERIGALATQVLYAGLGNGEFQASPALPWIDSVTGTCDVRTNEDVPGRQVQGVA